MVLWVIGGIPPLYRLFVLSVCAHLFWRNHQPTTLIFNKDPHHHHHHHNNTTEEEDRADNTPSPPPLAALFVVGGGGGRRREEKKKRKNILYARNAFFCMMMYSSISVLYLSLIFLYSAVEGRVLSQPPRGSWAPTPLYLCCPCVRACVCLCAPFLAQPPANDPHI